MRKRLGWRQSVAAAIILSTAGIVGAETMAAPAPTGPYAVGRLG